MEEPLLNEEKLVESKFNFKKESNELFNLAVGFFFARVSWIMIKITDTALIGVRIYILITFYSTLVLCI